MGRRIGDNLVSSQFAQIGVHQELNQANQKIEELTTEIERLKASGNKSAEEKKVVELHSSLQSQGIQKIALSQIKPNPEQPRQTFSSESLLLLARSLESDGQQQPILLFAHRDKEYFLFDGERRWRAAQLLRWKIIDAVIIPQRDSASLEKPETLRRQALLVNHHRENLNPLDLAEALVKEIATREGISELEIPKLLNALMARLTRRNLVDELTTLVSMTKEKQEEKLQKLASEGVIKEQENQIVRCLLSFQLNPASIKANVFPSLKFSDDLKAAIRNDGLGGHHAKVIQQLNAESLDKSEKEALIIRQQLTKEVIEGKLSVAATRTRVASELAKHTQQEKPLMSTVTQKAIAVITGVKLNEMEKTELEAFEKALKEKLKEIRANFKK
ncbi:ParB/RepB/Spo0J family partition protein [Candidatus Gracilibacteria bacterium]|nr:ParB/RepB/Spo0J family partition protein [Candidatus Gracilibacteria bacterium]NJM90535.1 ParB/RepB/Spo0J family partition protein [Hydrococcus sp. RU_2_2]